MAKQANFTGRMNERRKAAAERTAARAARTPQQQLELLDKRLGAGVGAAKERAKLAKLIAAVAA